MKTTIENLLAERIKPLIDNNNIISIFIVGSMVSNNYVEKKLNDYDIRFIVKEMNQDIYYKIQDILEKLKDDIEKENIGCSVSDLIGPVKMEPKKERNVLIHALTMTENDLEELPNIHKYSYCTNYQQIYGKDLLSKYNKIVLNSNDVICSTEGIDFCIDLIKNKVVSYSKWVVKDDGSLILKRQVVPASKNDTVELFYYSYKKSLNNIKNLLKTNNLNIDLNKYLNFTCEENELISKIESNTLSLNDVLDCDTITKILYKLEKCCIILDEKVKKFYNSLDWGIINKNCNTIRGNGFIFLKNLNLPMGNNFSVKSQVYQNRKFEIENEISKSDYIVIFDPSSNNFQKYGMHNVNSVTSIDDYIDKNNININLYNISFIEQIKKVDNSFVGTVMSNGKGKTIIEILSDTVDSRELTSRGANSKLIKTYDFTEFNDYCFNVPAIIKEIKKMCEFFQGYYEFAYGKIRDEKDIYFTFYSKNKKYINIFGGDEEKCKILKK